MDIEFSLKGKYQDRKRYEPGKPENLPIKFCLTAFAAHSFVIFMEE